MTVLCLKHKKWRVAAPPPAVTFNNADAGSRTPAQVAVAPRSNELALASFYRSSASRGTEAGTEGRTRVNEPLRT